MRFPKKMLVFVITVVLVILAGCVFLAQPMVKPLAITPPPVDTGKLRAHVRMLSEQLYPRSFDHPKMLRAAASYIQAQFAATGAVAQEQVFTDDGDQYLNILARFGPADGPVIVIGAHYDSHADEARGGGFPLGYDITTHTPGADDNASGVAGLIELARLLTAMPPKTGVELVAYTLEEPPNFRTQAMGSAHHARSMRASGRQVKVMVSLEMIGYFDSRPVTQTYPVPGLALLYPNRGDFIAIVGRIQDWAVTRRVKAGMLGASDLPVRSINALALLPGIGFSDHGSYWAEGFSALMVTDTAFFRNPNYHQAGDVASTLDYERMAKVIQGIFGAIQNYGATQ
jgi:Zn-dependent M28 family amino/carboxypeptidase